MSVNVVVDLGVNTNATGTIDVFGQTAPVITNKVIASVNVPVSTIIGGGVSTLIEFQGQDNDIAGRLETVFTTGGGFAARKTALASAIQAALVGALDASAAEPFNITAKYTDAGYKNYTSFGSLALGAYAHYLFGHVDATAAIDNDTTFVSKMNGTNTLSGEANLGGALADLIFTLDAAKCTAIAKQVIGQDASRAFGVDNDNTTPDGWQKLIFKPGDKIYVSVTLAAPTVTVLGNNTAQQSEPSAALFANNIKYMVEITLSNA